MNEAYDVKHLAAKLEALGISEAEKIAKGIVSEVFDWAKESASMSATPIDDILVPVYSYVKDILISKLDVIAP